MDAAGADTTWWVNWLVVGPLLLLSVLVAPTYAGGLILRLAVALHNAAWPASPVPAPARGQAMGIIFLATLFNLLVTWSYMTTFADEPTMQPSGFRRGFAEEQEAAVEPDSSQARLVVGAAILAIRALLLGLAVLILSRILLPTTPWRAFLVTGNYWLIGAALLAVVFFLFGLDTFLPRRR